MKIQLKYHFKDIFKNIFSSILTSKNVLITASTHYFPYDPFTSDPLTCDKLITKISLWKFKTNLEGKTKIHLFRDNILNTYYRHFTNMIISPDEKFLLICQKNEVIIYSLYNYYRIDYIKCNEFYANGSLCNFIDTNNLVIYFRKDKECSFLFYSFEPGELIEIFGSKINKKNDLIRINHIKTISNLGADPVPKDIDDFIIVNNKIILKNFNNRIKIIDFNGNILFQHIFVNREDVKFKYLSFYKDKMYKSFLGFHNNQIIFKFYKSPNVLFRMDFNKCIIKSSKSKKPSAHIYDVTFVPCIKSFSLINNYFNRYLNKRLHIKINDDIFKLIYNYLVDSIYVTDDGIVDIRRCK